LNSSMNAGEIHDLVYTVAEQNGLKTSKLFKALYASLISKDHGPRFGKLIVALGVQRIKEVLQELYQNTQ